MDEQKILEEMARNEYIAALVRNISAGGFIALITAIAALCHTWFLQCGKTQSLVDEVKEIKKHG